MKKFPYLFILIPSFLLGQEPETEKGIHFDHSSFTELLAKAKKENKIIMVDAYTSWCGPCKWMVKNIFPNDTVAAYYNTNFINAKIDMEKGEGIELAKKYEVSCYPTYLFIDGSGQLLHRRSSSMEAKEFIGLGTAALDPAKQFSTYRKKYEAGNAIPDEMAEYVTMRGRTCLPVKEEMGQYFKTQKDEDLLSQRNWNILVECRMDIRADSREFRYLIDHRADYEKLYTPGMVAGLIKSCYSFALRNYVTDKNMDGYNKLKEEITQKKLPFGEEMLLNSDMSLYKSTKDWSSYAEVAAKYIDKFKKEDYNTLNTIAWDFYENVSDVAMLAKAEEWAKHSVELHTGYFNTDTYAAVLYKLGKKQEAMAAAERAIELAKKENQDFKDTQQMLDKIKALQ